MTFLSWFSHMRLNMQEADNWAIPRFCGDSKMYVPWYAAEDDLRIKRTFCSSATDEGHSTEQRVEDDDEDENRSADEKYTSYRNNLWKRLSSVSRCTDLGWILPKTNGHFEEWNKQNKTIVEVRKRRFLKCMKGLTRNGYRVFNDEGYIHIACLNDINFTNPITCPEYLQTLYILQKSNMLCFNNRQKTFYRHLFHQQNENERNSRFGFIYLQNLYHSQCYNHASSEKRMEDLYFYRIGCALVGTHALKHHGHDKHIQDIGRRFATLVQHSGSYNNKSQASLGDDIKNKKHFRQKKMR